MYSSNTVIIDQDFLFKIPRKRSVREGTPGKEERGSPGLYLGMPFIIFGFLPRHRRVMYGRLTVMSVFLRTSSREK